MKYKPEIVTAYFKSCGLSAPEFEFKFHPVRKWRFDVCWPVHKIAIEVDGGIWITGGHNRGAQIKKDWIKRNTATAMGWAILYCEPRDLCRQEMVDLVKASAHTESALTTEHTG